MYSRVSPQGNGSSFLTMLSTERLILRPFLKTDYNDYYEYMSCKDIYRFERGEPISLKDAKKFCKEWSSKKEINFWAATLKEGGNKLIGNVSFFQIEPKFLRTWEIGFVFNPSFQNKGYATEASQAVIEYAFTKLGAHRATGHCSPDNTASWRVLEKCGLKREGLEKKNFLIRYDEKGNPIWLDSYQYAILDEEYRRV
jgi:ribosomal-protein-alanine N-acetyltransferase